MDPIFLIMLKSFLKLAGRIGTDIVLAEIEDAEKSRTISLEDVESKLITEADKRAAMEG